MARTNRNAGRGNRTRKPPNTERVESERRDENADREVGHDEETLEPYSPVPPARGMANPNDISVNDSGGRATRDTPSDTRPGARRSAQAERRARDSDRQRDREASRRKNRNSERRGRPGAALAEAMNKVSAEGRRVLRRLLGRGN